MCREDVFRKLFFLKWKTEGSLTHVILMVDYRVVICFVAGVSLCWLYVISPVAGMDRSLKLTLQHRAMAG